MLNTDGIGEYVRALREELHQYPETDFNEYKTKSIIERELGLIGVPYKTLAKTGTVGCIFGKKTGKTVLLRADIDGLPITEATDVSFKSKNEGFMHACGHDVHTACLLGAAKMLNEIKDEICGNIKLVFQPAEEGVGGAKPMIDEGVLTNPDVGAAFALHVEPLERAGNIQIKDGAIMASPDEFTLKIHGVGGHGSAPHQCIDPIAISAEIINIFQKLSRSYVSPFNSCVISVCSIHSGTCPNVIPSEAVLEGTVRTFDEEIRTKIAAELSKKANSVCELYGAKCDFEYRYLYPPLINDSKMNKLAERAAKKIPGIQKVVHLDTASMAGDDFSYFAREVPSAYFKLGVGNDGIKKPIHSNLFDIDNSALPLGAAVMAQTALEYLQAENEVF